MGDIADYYTEVYYESDQDHLPPSNKESSMPAQSGKSPLFKKLGTKLTSAVKKHAHDDINYGRVDLPGGIKNGIAQLTKLYFKQYENGDNKGEYYLRGEGVVVKPKIVATPNGDVKVEGLTTSIMFPVCETTNSKGKETSLDEAVARVTNELKKLGADPDRMAESPEELEEIAAELQEAAPYFKFTTQTGKATKEFPNPRVWENWNGLAEDFDPESSGDDDVEDATGGEEEEKPDVEEEAEAAEESSDEGDDLDSLAETADDDSNDECSAACKELLKRGLAVGLSKKWIEDVAKNWAAVVEKIREKSDGEKEEEEAEAEDDRPTEDEEPEEEEYIPSKEDIVMYKGKKDKKKMEYNVVAVNKVKKTVDLLSNDDGKTKYAMVKWSDISVS